MNPESIRSIRRSWEHLSRDPELVLGFYSKLFELAPDTKRYFPNDLTKQSEKLAHTLNFLVMNLDRLDEIKESIEDLGRFHHKLKIKVEYYGFVKQALLVTIRESLAEKCEEDIIHAWDTALTFVARVMIEAPAERQPRMLKLWKSLFSKKSS